jgi:TrmH family RNA methyltransferase
MGAVFDQPLVRAAIAETPEPRAALVAHGGEGLQALDRAATICLGAEREGVPEEVLASCQSRVTIPLREGAESLNVAAAAAVALQRLCEGAAQAKPSGNPK